MDNKYVIAIDGPGASGKSSTAKGLAAKLQYVYIDTGAMYRACGLAALQNKIKLSDLPALKKMLEKIEIKIIYSNSGNKVLLNGADVSQEIREAEISKISSEIAVIGEVRHKMVELQRQMGAAGGVILDGRDIGTVVFPEADFKFFMIADVDERAQRRWQELQERGRAVTLQAVKDELIWRDNNDSSRKISPLKKADDAIEIDTTKMSIEQQVDFLYDYIIKHMEK
ncbi:MAG: (d)CMP kinase [Candidatus Cloacimonadales bacterium]